MLKMIRWCEAERVNPIFYFLVFLVCGFPASAQTATAAKSLAIPRGTVLPVLLETAISPSKVKQGQIIRGHIAQEVPLPGGSKIRKGSKVEGHVVEVSASGNIADKKIAIRFDKLQWQGKAVSITTDLRAIAGFSTVMQAGLPNQGIGESDVSEWMTTTQIGGDSVYGLGGPVTSAHNADDVVGRSPMSGGVLVEVRANSNGQCRGALDGNNDPQALWVFSSDACGTYGLSQVSIAHAGRTDPAGTIILEMQSPKAKIHSGAGMLLRVIA